MMEIRDDGMVTYRPIVNAVIVQIVPGPTTGQMQRLISIECKDEKMRTVLGIEARKIMGHPT